MSLVESPPLGLYIHIPFCSRLCHYCDFAKTANFSQNHVRNYMRLIERHLDEWLDGLWSSQKFTSVFFGGGTPGLFTEEYGPMMRKILSASIPGVEVTLEANPDNVTQDRAALWRDLGFNRLSMGVQTFDEAGLRFLTRDHSPEQATRALNIAARYFPKSNGDLIYGWSGQTDHHWRDDLSQMIDTGVNHISLYALTFEGRTPFARAERRGLLHSASDEALFQKYDIACQELRKSHYFHEEISNWAKDHKSCEHNWLYWRGQHFLGLGAGAHGFLDDGTLAGVRYEYSGDIRTFLRESEKLCQRGATQSANVRDFLAQTSAQISGDRAPWDWVQEYVGCALRTADGVDLALLERFQYRLEPNPVVRRALTEGLLTLTNNHLTAQEPEWFRETGWSYYILESLVGPEKLKADH